MTSRNSIRLLLAFGVCALWSLPASADDRDVLRDSATRPYLFIVLDTSGSMNWAPRCTAEQVAAGICSYRCDTGDCATPRNGDDPASKFRQSKEALYEVLRSVDDVDFGFATFNQDNLGVLNKHWLYRVRAGQPQVALAGGFRWPQHGSEEVFGATFACDQGNGDAEIACYANGNDAADTGDLWEVTRARRFSKLNTNGSTAGSVYVRDGGRVYYITYDDPGAAQTLGNAAITVRIRVDRCTGTPADNPSNNCDVAGERSLVGQVDVVYDRIGDFVHWDFAVDRTPSLGSADGWWGGAGRDSTASNTCEGWEPNDDTNLSDDAEDDDYNNTYGLKHPTSSTPLFDPPGTASDWRFQLGDVIPLVWTQSNKDLVLNRLAARLNGGDPATDPEAFANATYLNDNRSGGDTFLRYKNSNQKSLFPNGSTPLGYTLRSFREWYRGCENGVCPSVEGWDDIAAFNDPKWACRQKFLLVLTDGDDTCPGRDPCSFTASMRALDGILTYVVAFGVQNTSGNRLNCMAANGGTGDPIYPQNKQELVAALNTILGRVREQAAAFASAAVPQVQANVSDKIFLSSFTPLNDSAYWAGRLDAFLKPLPLDDSGRPDRSIQCDSSVQSQCFLWDAGDVQIGHRGGAGTYSPERLLVQAPHPDDVAPTSPWNANDLLLGIGADQRRVVYSQFNEPGNRRLFTYPTNNSEKYDLWTGLGLSFIVGDTTSENNATASANAAIVTSLLEKEGTIETPDPADPTSTIQEPVTFLMGDIFHADPTVFGRPSSFGLYTSDPYLNQPLCGAAPDPARYPPPSYRWFADRNFCRRSVMLAASNDGQLHAFDAGIFRDAGGADYECLVPAKDLDGDGARETNEFNDSVIDYDLDDTVDGLKACTSDGDCAAGPCSSGFCRDVKVGVIDGAFDNGTGRELFSFIPRAMMPTIYSMTKGANRNSEFWGMDSGVRVDDVFIDPLASDAGSVTCLDREWRTVVIGGYREGGPGIYALDVTQPDELNGENVPVPQNGYVPSCFDGGSDCQNRPYPAVLWEFQDMETVQVSAGVFQTVRLDEDASGTTDLANSWSKPITGRIRVCTDPCGADETEDRFVAIFGGGVADSPSIDSGNFVYMVDVETGKTIYKKQVRGSVPADVTAVDANSDGYIDRLYVGTTAGFMYKIQLEGNPSNPMRLVSRNYQTLVSGVLRNFSATRLEGPVADETRYDPFQLFSTGGRPIYLEPTAIFVGRLNRIALAFGTGNRWNLWDSSGQQGRFYVILDDNYEDTNRDGVLDVSCSGCTQPLTEASYVAIDPDAAFNPLTPSYYLYDGNGSGSLRGWYFTLPANEKVITEAFSLSGITIFTAFEPTDVTNSDGTCSRGGRSKVFIVGTVTALGYSYETVAAGGSVRTRYTEIPQFTTPPFVEQSATANPDSGGGDQHADFITEALALIRDELKTLQSTRCRYASYTQNIKTIRSDTGVVFVAPIPICIDPTSWKEF